MDTKVTLKNLSSSTAQEVFDTVSQHLLTQNAESLSDSGMCVYRSPKGFSCAAGCLMTDQEYKPEWEGLTWVELVEEGQIPDVHQILITELQGIHDFLSPLEWKEGLTYTADRYHLTFTPTEK